MKRGENESVGRESERDGERARARERAESEHALRRTFRSRARAAPDRVRVAGLAAAFAVRAAGACPALRPRAAPRVTARTASVAMGPKKRTSTDTDAAGAVPPAAADGDGAGASPKKKRGEKGSEKAKPAAKAPAEKTVIPKAELKKPSPPPAGARLFKVAARAPPRACRPAPVGCCAACLTRAGAAQIISWNVTTLRSLVNKNPQLLATLFQQERPDVVVLQETKLNEVDHAEYEEKIAKVRRPGGPLASLCACQFRIAGRRAASACKCVVCNVCRLPAR